jgi:hypothetical protein
MIQFITLSANYSIASIAFPIIAFVALSIFSIQWYRHIIVPEQRVKKYSREKRRWKA